MPPSPAQRTQVYAFALTAVITATALRLLAQPIFGDTTPYSFYILPIIAAAAYGGLLPGLFATASSTAVIVFLGRHPLARPDATYFVIFLLDGLAISWLGERMSSAMRTAALASRETAGALERERAILNSISDAFGSLDENWQFLHANERFATLTGQELDQPGKSPRRVAQLAEAPVREELERAMREQIPVRVEVFMQRANRWYETSAYPLARGLSVFSRDITDRKHSEVILREAGVTVSDWPGRTHRHLELGSGEAELRLLRGTGTNLRRRKQVYLRNRGVLLQPDSCGRSSGGAEGHHARSNTAARLRLSFATGTRAAKRAGCSAGAACVPILPVFPAGWWV